MSLVASIRYVIVGVSSLTAIVRAEPGEPFSRAGLDAEAVPLTTAPYPEEVTDEAGYARWLARRTAALREVAQRAEDPIERAAAWLAVANWRLATECEPALSRMLQGIASPQDDDFVVGLANDCVATLQVSRELLQASRPTAGSDPPAESDLEASIDTLEAFARAFHAFAASDQDDASAERGRQAARALSPYLEDERTDVAAAALLWQAVLYGRSEQSDRVMRLLPLVTEPLRREALRCDFFARLLRCRFLVRRQAFAAAWTLALYLEERSYDWFSQPALRSAACGSADLVKTRICEQWPAAAPEAQRAKTHEWCQGVTSRLHDKQPGGGVMRLDTAAPVVVDIPEATKPGNSSPGISEAPPARQDASNAASESDDAPERPPGGDLRPENSKPN